MAAVLPRARTNRRRHAETLPRRGGFTGSLSWDPLAVTLHDIRGPLAVIATAAELLQKRVEPRGAADEAVLLQRIQRNTSWLASLVDNLAGEVELSTSHLSFDWATVDLHECLETALGIVQTHLDQRHQEVRWTREDVVQVYGDRRRIQQVLINLLMNACKYGDAHRDIRITVESRGSWTRVEIKNDGPSIPKGEQDRIFEPFVRGSNAESASGTGLGLGLHIVKTIVEGHGGRVGVVSSPEQGTAFWFTLPSAHEPARE